MTPKHPQADGGENPLQVAEGNMEQDFFTEVGTAAKTSAWKLLCVNKNQLAGDTIQCGRSSVSSFCTSRLCEEKPACLPSCFHPASEEKTHANALYNYP